MSLLVKRTTTWVLLCFFEQVAIANAQNFDDAEKLVPVLWLLLNDEPVSDTFTIQAENFTFQQGISLEESRDEGGGLHVAFIQDGDFTEYTIVIPKSGVYEFSARVSSGANGGSIGLIVNGDNLGSATVPSTGGWQSFITVTERLELEEGRHTLRLAYSGDDGFLFNINLFSFSYIDEDDDCTFVNSLPEFASYLAMSDQCIRVAPGTYTFDTSNVGEGLLFSNTEVISVTGSNNTYIFDDVKFEFDTQIFRQFGQASVHEFHVLGNDNVFRGLTMEDIGDTAPLRSARAIMMDGADNLIENFTVTTRGSFPYGYGDIFGKGSARVINHRKHSGVLVRGDRNHLKGLNLHMNTYGHGIFVQGGRDIIIEDCYVEGELSTVSAVLAERGTGSAADDVNFETIWGYNLDELTEDYHFSLQEDGIRAYSTGGIYGTDDNRDTGNITVLNSTVKFMRSGVTLGLGRGDSYVENCTALGTESGFWVGSNGTIKNSRGDSSVGPLYSEDAARSGNEIELTLLDNVVAKIGNTPTIYLAGDRHTMTLKDGTTTFNPEFNLLVGGTRYGHRWLEGSDEEPLRREATRITLDNQTPYAVTLGDTSSDNDVESCGHVIDDGDDNSVSGGANCSN